MNPNDLFRKTRSKHDNLRRRLPRATTLSAFLLLLSVVYLSPASADHNLGWWNCYDAGLSGHEDTGLYCVDIAGRNYCWFELPVQPENRDPGCSLYIDYCLFGQAWGVYVGVDAFARDHREEVNSEYRYQSGQYSFCYDMYF